MAYEVFSRNPDEEDKKRRAGGASADNTGMTIGAAQDFSPQYTSQAAGSGVAGDSGSNFVNFDQYFNANSTAADKMANTVTNTVGNNALQAKQGVDKATTAFNADVTKGTPKWASPSIGTPQGEDPKDGQTEADQLAPGQISRGEAAKRAGAGYSGPAGFSQVKNYADLVKGITGAHEQVNALAQPGGKQALAQTLLGSSTQGGSELDAALMGRAGQGKFDQVHDQYKGLNDYFDNAAKGADARVGSAKADAASVQQGYKGLVDRYDTAAAEKAAKAAAEGEKDTSGPATGAQSYSDYRGETNSLVNAPIQESLYKKLTRNEMVKLKTFHKDNSAEYQRYAKELAAKYGEKF